LQIKKYFQTILTKLFTYPEIIPQEDKMKTSNRENYKESIHCIDHWIVFCDCHFWRRWWMETYTLALVLHPCPDCINLLYRCKE
jgi:hypothetical protein